MSETSHPVAPNTSAANALREMGSRETGDDAGYMGDHRKRKLKCVKWFIR